MQTALALLCALLLTACSTAGSGTGPVDRAVIGGLAGALVGGVLGNRLDRSGGRLAGTLIGAALGGAGGAAIGHAMDRQQRELERRLASERERHAVAVRRLESDLLQLSLAGDVMFASDSPEVRPAFRPTLAKLGGVLADCERCQVMVVGHADATGSEARNEALSLARAEAVRDVLASAGVPHQRMIALGQGEATPRADNRSRSGRQLNRRVEILVTTVT